MFQSMHTSSIIDRSDSASLNERFEQRPELSRPPEVLRMPLYAEAESAARILDGFDDAVGRGRRCDESFAEILGRLVMPAVDRTGLTGLEPLAHQTLEQRPRLDPDVVRNREARLLQPVLHGGAHFV